MYLSLSISLSLSLSLVSAGSAGAKKLVSWGQPGQKDGQMGSVRPKSWSAGLSRTKKSVSRAQRGVEVGHRGSAGLSGAWKLVLGVADTI